MYSIIKLWTAALLPALALAASACSSGDKAAVTLDRQRLDMLTVYGKLRHTLAELGVVDVALGGWSSCRDQGSDLQYTLSTALVPSPQERDGFADRVQGRVAARMKELPDPRLRWSVGEQDPSDGRVVVLWVHDSCVEVPRDVFNARLGRRERLA